MSYLRVPATSHGPIMPFVKQVVIHGTVSPCRPGQAAADARYVNSVGLSCHYFVDPAQVVQQLDENIQGFHDGYNLYQIGVELCDPQAGDPARWHDPAHEQMLARAAELVRGICARWQIPVTRVRSDLRTSPTNGLCGHADASQTWRMSTHTDPGADFPWDHFVALVAGSNPAPASKPTGGTLSMADAASIEKKIDVLAGNVERLYRLSVWNTEPGGNPGSSGLAWPSLMGNRTQLNEVLGQLNKIVAQLHDPAQAGNVETVRADLAALAGVVAGLVQSVEHPPAA